MVKNSEKPKARALRKKSGSPPDMDGVVRVNFDINRADHVKLKIYAAKSGCSMADLLRAFVASLKMSGVK
jgi:hypothetical protein